jgi:hypothetical protein
LRPCPPCLFPCRPGNPLQRKKAEGDEKKVYVMICERSGGKIQLIESIIDVYAGEKNSFFANYLPI